MTIVFYPKNEPLNRCICMTFLGLLLENLPYIKRSDFPAFISDYDVLTSCVMRTGYTSGKKIGPYFKHIKSVLPGEDCLIYGSIKMYINVQNITKYRVHLVLIKELGPKLLREQK